MLFPIAHADPTELIATLDTRHMVTPGVLFNVFLALGADFRVCRNPVDIFRLCAGFIAPLSGSLTVAGLMGKFSAHEAKDSAALAGDIVENSAHIGTFNAELALYARAPLDILIVVSEGLAQPLPIGLFVLW